MTRRHLNHHRDAPSLHGSAADDILVAGKHAVAFYGRAGDDVLIGSPKIDSLVGGQGNDILKGGRGADTLYGGDGNDILIGGGGSRNGANNDLFFGGSGFNIYIGGKGSDVFFFDGGINTVRNVHTRDDFAFVDVSRYFSAAPDAAAIYDRATGVLSLQRDGADAGSTVIKIGFFEPGFDLRDSHILLI